MSNPFTDRIADQAIDNVEKMMANNPTIPAEAEHDLLKEEFDRLMVEAEKYDTF